MKKMLYCVLAVVLVTLAVTAASSAGLSDAEHKRMLQASPEFAAAEKHMNAAWTALRKVADAKEMEEYKEWQIDWIGQQRQESVAAMLTTKKDMALIPKGALKDGKVNKDLAYAVVTEERALWLDALTKQKEDVSYLPEFTGRIYWGRNPAGGYLAFTPDGWWTEFLLCYAMSIDNIPNGARVKEALEKSSLGSITASVTGRLTSELGFEWDQTTPGVTQFSVKIEGE